MKYFKKNSKQLFLGILKSLFFYGKELILAHPRIELIMRKFLVRMPLINRVIKKLIVTHSVPYAPIENVSNKSLDHMRKIQSLLSLVETEKKLSCSHSYIITHDKVRERD